jgi:tripartite-type tricarboxylate transporter receptor subunit TctC
MRVLRLILAAVVALGSVTTANAQGAYPERTIRLIVPFPPGQATDILARIVAEQLTVKLKQSVVIDNRTGAGGIIGTDAGAKAPPDGYTLVMVSSGPLAINPFTYSKVPYDPLNDFAPITNMASVAHVLVTTPDFPARTLQELIQAIKAKPGAYSFASPGAGTTQHLSMEMLRSRSGMEMVHVPYRGSGPAQIDLMGGRVALMFDAVQSVSGLLREGKLKAIAVSTATRSPFVPDVPTVAESGLPGFDSSGWIGIAAPAGTPPAIVNRLNAEIVSILQTAELQERLKAAGFVAIGDSPERFRAFIRSEVAKFEKIVKEVGIKLD